MSNEISYDDEWIGLPMTSFNPVKGESDVAGKKVWKVPVFKKGNVFVVWTGDNVVRYFSEETLPNEVRIPLGIIMNSPKAAELNQKEMTDINMANGVTQEEIFKSGMFDKVYEDIGWQYNKYYYVVVLSEEELASVRAGQESKEESTDKVTKAKAKAASESAKG